MTEAERQDGPAEKCGFSEAALKVQRPAHS